MIAVRSKADLAQPAPFWGSAPVACPVAFVRPAPPSARRRHRRQRADTCRAGKRLAEQIASDTVVVGHSHASAEADHTECVLACAKEQACAGFNFDAKNSMYSLMGSADSSSPFPGVESGLKASN